MHESISREHVTDVIYDTEGACEGQYGWMQGLIQVLLRADMDSREGAVFGLESRAVSAKVTKHFITIFIKLSYNGAYHIIAHNTLINAHAEVSKEVRVNSVVPVLINIHTLCTHAGKA